MGYEGRCPEIAGVAFVFWGEAGEDLALRLCVDLGLEREAAFAERGPLAAAHERATGAKTASADGRDGRVMNSDAKGLVPKNHITHRKSTRGLKATNNLLHKRHLKSFLMLNSFHHHHWTSSWRPCQRS
jgi:hypothetical protein